MYIYIYTGPAGMEMFPLNNDIYNYNYYKMIMHCAAMDTQIACANIKCTLHKQQQQNQTNKITKKSWLAAIEIRNW